MCSICNKGYHSSSNLKKHEETKHFYVETNDENEIEHPKKTQQNFKNKQLGIECKMCNKFFKRQGYGTHMRIHIKEKKQFLCDICKKSFQKNSHLERHRRIHTGELFVNMRIITVTNF